MRSAIANSPIDPHTRLGELRSLNASKLRLVGLPAVLDILSIRAILDIWSRPSMLKEPLSEPDVKRVIREILENGLVEFSPHALQRMAARGGLSQVDIVNTLRGGRLDRAEPEGGEWRYNISTARMCVVITFESEDHLIVVTVIRFS